MKKILSSLLIIPLLLVGGFLLQHVIPFVFEIVFGIVLLKETASTNLPSWLPYLFDVVSGIIVLIGLKFRQNEKRFEFVTTIISCVFVVIASHIATYSWLYFTIACLALLSLILWFANNLLESSFTQKEN